MEYASIIFAAVFIIIIINIIIIILQCYSSTVNCSEMIRLWSQSLGWNLRWCCMNMICRGTNLTWAAKLFCATCFSCSRPVVLHYSIVSELLQTHTHTHTHTQDMNRFAAVQLCLTVMFLFFCQPLDLHSCPESYWVWFVSLCLAVSGVCIIRSTTVRASFQRSEWFLLEGTTRGQCFFRPCLVQVPELQRVLCCIKVLSGPQWR